MRNKIFICHANDEDNDQARWLGLQLMTLGYEVWCDVFNLKGGEKFWKDIEFEIRNNTCKFLYILTNNSNQRDGCLNELDVAESVNKDIADERFIVTLHFDSLLNFDAINIKLKRKIHLNFKSDWQQGLKDLLNIFKEKPVVPLKDSPDYEYITKYWQTIFLNDRKPIEKKETYSSNWFPFLNFPQFLYFHNFKGLIPKDFDWNSLKYPTQGYKKLTVTFANCYDFIAQLPKTKDYDQTKTVAIDVKKILFDNYEDKFISNRTAKNILNNLISKGFIQTLIQKDLIPYEMSNKVALCFREKTIHKKEYSHGLLVGILKYKNWHFAISGFPDLVKNVFVFRSHILFSDENHQLISSKRVQQSARRKLGKSWWNKHWRDKLLTAISNLVDDDQLFRIKVGNEIFVVIDGKPLAFHSTISYLDPDESKEALDENQDKDEEILEN